MGIVSKIRRALYSARDVSISSQTGEVAGAGEFVPNVGAETERYATGCPKKKN